MAQSILITGASSGLGAALARGYAAQGIRLLLTGRDAQRLHDVASDCRARGAEVQTSLINVYDREMLASWMLAMDDLQPIDLVIANAGVSAGSGDSTETAEQVQKIFTTNVDGVLNTLHPLMPRMIARKAGHFAIVSSLAGIRALPSAPAYSASKAAVRYYGEALRGLLKPHGVTVSVICPGYIHTPMTAVNDFPMPFVMSSERAVQRIKSGLMHKKGRIAFPRRLYYPLWLISCVHHSISDPFFDAMPSKPHFS